MRGPRASDAGGGAGAARAAVAGVPGEGLVVGRRLRRRDVGRRGSRAGGRRVAELRERVEGLALVVARRPAAAGRPLLVGEARGPRGARAVLAGRQRPRHGGCDRLLFLRREVAVGDAVAQVLDVDAREVARRDGAEHDARAVVVEQGERSALFAAGVAEAIVAPDRPVGHRVVQAPLLLVELIGEDLDGLAQVAHLRIEVLHVLDDVALLVVAHDHQLRAPQAAHGAPQGCLLYTSDAADDL